MNTKKDSLFQIPAQITKLETQSDGGIRVVIDTQELSDPEELKQLFMLRKSIGWFSFKSNKITQGEIPDEDAMVEEGETKSPSERLRNTLFVYWKENKGGKGDFNAFYKETMEKYIQNVKEKLPPRGD
jgi:hypothetical protein